MELDKFIERKITIGLIISTNYLRKVYDNFDLNFIEGKELRLICEWSLEYFLQYKKAPMQNIETIYFDKLKKQKIRDKNTAEWIEQEILPSLSDEYENEDFDVEYLFKQTKLHFADRNLKLHNEKLEDLLIKGDIEGANVLAANYKPILFEPDDSIDLSDPKVLKKVSQAFDKLSTPILKYPRALGSVLNEHLVRGGFVAFMATEKRGKSFWLLDMAARATRQKLNVAMFQAGDMTEAAQLRRAAIYSAKKSDKEKYSGEMFEPVRDCIYNQLDKCDRKERECDFGVFEGENEEYLKTVPLTELIERYNEEKDYKPCYNCQLYNNNPWGTPWIKKINTGAPLTKVEARKAIRQFFVRNKRHLRLSTHLNGTLSVNKMETILDKWEREEGFVPDLIIVDYAELLIGNEKEYRHKQDEIWKQLRALSQSKDEKYLVVTVTQADADSYERGTLNKRNFSEDKRKYAHATAFFGLNQDPKDREKSIGIMRFNEIFLREGELITGKQVAVLQNLKRGQAYLTSYFTKQY